MEETYENVINMCKFQLENNVYPEFDPVYKVDPSGKGMQKNVPVFIICFTNFIFQKVVCYQKPSEKVEQVPLVGKRFLQSITN